MADATVATGGITPCVKYPGTENQALDELLEGDWNLRI
jgi:hypothetical protein